MISPVAGEPHLEASLVRTVFDTSIICASSEANMMLAEVLPCVRIRLLWAGPRPI